MSYDVLFEGVKGALLPNDITECLAGLDLTNSSVEKRRITVFFLHAQRKRWLGGTYAYSVIDIQHRLERPIYVSPWDVWAGTVCQNPMVPVMTMHDVPKKFQLAVSKLRQLETNEASVVLASLASKHGRLPSMTLRHQEQSHRPILEMWLVAAVLCRATNDTVSLAAWQRYHHKPGGGNAAHNKAAILSSGLRSKVATVALVDSLGAKFWAMLWRSSTADIINVHLDRPHIKHKTVACMLLYGMKRPCIVMDRNVAVSTERMFGLPAGLPTDVLFWWAMTQIPAGMVYDLSLLLLEEGRKGKRANEEEKGRKGKRAKH